MPTCDASLRLPLDYESEPLADIRPPGLYVLRGPRRVGKSLELNASIMRLLAHGVDPKLVFYCSCDGLSTQDLQPARAGDAQRQPAHSTGLATGFSTR